MQNKFPITGEKEKEVSPFVRSKFRQLQVTGQEAELFFMHNYKEIDTFKEGDLKDARLFGDGYDFQIEIQQHFFLVETKGLRTFSGSIRMTQNEYKKAEEYKDDYALVVVSDLANIPVMRVVFNPLNKLDFIKKPVRVAKQFSYHTKWTGKGVVVCH